MVLLLLKDEKSCALSYLPSGFFSQCLQYPSEDVGSINNWEPYCDIKQAGKNMYFNNSLIQSTVITAKMPRSQVQSRFSKKKSNLKICWLRKFIIQTRVSSYCLGDV